MNAAFNVTPSLETILALIAEKLPGWQWVMRSNHGEFFANLTSPACDEWDDIEGHWSGNFDNPACQSYPVHDGVSPADALYRAFLAATDKG